MFDVQDVTMRLAGPGEEITPEYDMGDQVVPEGKCALVLSRYGRDVFALVGTAEQLRHQVWEGLMLPVPEGVSLFDTTAEEAVIIVPPQEPPQ